MSDKYRVATAEEAVAAGYGWAAEEAYYGEVLIGPDGFSCAIYADSPEDHLWTRDLWPVIEELNKISTRQ